nr:ferrous iron transport protein A [Pyrinomonadaceae bacterium]
RLRYVAKLGVVPQALVKVAESAPFEGPLTIRIGKKAHALDRQLARTILVELC